MNYQPPQPNQPVPMPQPGQPVPQPNQPVPVPQPAAPLPGQPTIPGIVPPGIAPAPGASNPYGAPTTHSPNPAMKGAQVDFTVIDVLRRTKGWVQFMSLLMFIIVGLSLLGAPVMFKVHPISGIIYLAILALYLYPGIKLWQYGSGITKVMMDSSSISLAYALDKQRAFWKFVGILTIITLVISIIFPIIVGITVADRTMQRYEQRY